MRDDFAALSLAAIVYSMLHTTTTAFVAKKGAAPAESHVRDYADNIMRVNEIMPDVAIREFKKDGHEANECAATTTREAVGRSWEPR